MPHFICNQTYWRTPSWRSLAVLTVVNTFMHHRYFPHNRSPESTVDPCCSAALRELYVLTSSGTHVFINRTHPQILATGRIPWYSSTHLLTVPSGCTVQMMRMVCFPSLILFTVLHDDSKCDIHNVVDKKKLWRHSNHVSVTVGKQLNLFE